MAFTEITTAEDIFDVLETDPAFSALIGSLVLDGPAVPGMVIQSPSAPLEGMDSAQGLFVVIEKDPVFKSQRLLTAQVVVDRMFTIRLLQFEGAATRNLRAAIERLLEIFPGSSAIPLATPDVITGEGQAIVKLPSNPVAHT